MKQVYIVRKDLNMRKGKIAAQCAHGAVMCTLSWSHREKFKEWFNNGQTKICVSTDSEADLVFLAEKAVHNGLFTELVIDAGKTEFHGVPTKTVVVIGPDEDSKIDAITGHLPLL